MSSKEVVFEMIELPRIVSSRGSKSRNKVSVGEPADGSLHFFIVFSVYLAFCGMHGMIILNSILKYLLYVVLYKLTQPINITIEQNIFYIPVM